MPEVLSNSRSSSIPLIARLLGIRRPIGPSARVVTLTAVAVVQVITQPT
jgi:hypothetical protein